MPATTHDCRNALRPGTYPSVAVLGNTCAYDPALGLKTSSSFWVQNPQNTSQFLLQRTETYGYDPNLDYLTSASYNDGLPNASPSWSYDAAGNRTDSVCDNLNRPTSIGGVSCTSDILGNRLTTGANSYGWDALNRMTSMNSNAYQYRADGMRVAKTVSGVTTRYRYDGQMGMEDVDSTGKVTQYGLGARGIDFIENPAPSGGWVAFPVYDTHGNMAATLARNGGSYSLGNQRSFDAWGNVRLGAATGDPAGRYCGNLGHKQDDESGLVYMRARYYEPVSGRFISEDPGLQGANWFTYCGNIPIGGCDRSGLEWSQDDKDQFGIWFMAGVLQYAAAMVVISGAPTPHQMTSAEGKLARDMIIGAATAFCVAYSFTDSSAAAKSVIAVPPALYIVADLIARNIWLGTHYSMFTKIAVTSLALYDTVCLGLLLAIANTE